MFVCCFTTTVAKWDTMVRTRRMSARNARARSIASGDRSDKRKGSKPWFRKKHGLNGRGFIPGTDLTDEHCSKAKYIAFWGRKNYHNGRRYKKKGVS